jgi:hypothetical protein
MKVVAHKTEYSVPPTESMRLHQLKALEVVAEAWKDKDHPELNQGAAKWVRKLRKETERRFCKITGRGRLAVRISKI